MKKTYPHALRGAVCSALGGVCWGFSGTCGQYLFSHYPVSSLWLTCVRLLVGGGLLTLLCLRRHRADVAAILRTPRDLAMLVLYGVAGLLLCQYAYMTGIAYSNAATTTVLQNLGLLLIMGYTCLRQRCLPTRREGAALVLALCGVYLLATGGDPRHMALSPLGLFWGLAAAAAVALYSLLPQKLLTRYDRSAVVGPGMLIGGIALNLFALGRMDAVSLPPDGWLAVAAVVLLGTAVAFTLIMQGIVDAGPAKASMLASTEPLSATVFSALWLGTRFSAADLVGFAAIIATVFLLTRADEA